MNTAPNIAGRQARELTKHRWGRLRKFFNNENSRGFEINYIAIFGYAALSISELAEEKKAHLDDDYFFELMVDIGIHLTELDEKEIAEYVNGVIQRWEAAQIEVDGAGKTESTEETHQTTATI